ncbi:hypothetical protein D6858_04605 [Tsuneonella suprasediminis]|uniref:Uncharacterized protein n=1 Tax=Tsuneonella suprasediminis TaxID=2306996 RepID=A0A419R3R9_9SPHN|nr:hypothetical protein [Tsuneonella suprasediminis]RJX69177.1 hypothetical protein D6858_04605 [Tsuneonella suprasediminis]
MSFQPTLLAIVAGALVLPGIFAVWAFYRTARTDEIDLPLPGLKSAAGLGQIGAFALASHLVFAGLLLALVNSECGAWVASFNPYIKTVPDDPDELLRTIAGALFGLMILSLIALLLGLLAGEIVLSLGKGAMFYGAFSELFVAGKGSSKFIYGYILTKLEKNGSIIGYQGTVTSFIPGEDRFPEKIQLSNASMFTLNLYTGKRREFDTKIKSIALHRDEWSNIAFKVVEYRRGA